MEQPTNPPAANEEAQKQQPEQQPEQQQEKQLKPRNVHRLSRIFRKLKAGSTLPPRPWHPVKAPTITVQADGTTAPSQAVERRIGVPMEDIRRLVESLTVEERNRAVAGLDPLTPVQQELARRAARFGVQIQATPSAVPVVVDPEVLQRRQSRFGPVQPLGGSSNSSSGTAIGGTPLVAISPEDRAKMEARAKRFAATGAPIA